MSTQTVRIGFCRLNIRFLTMLLWKRCTPPSVLPGWFRLRMLPSAGLNVYRRLPLGGVCGMWLWENASHLPSKSLVLVILLKKKWSRGQLCVEWRWGEAALIWQWRSHAFVLSFWCICVSISPPHASSTHARLFPPRSQCGTHSLRITSAACCSHKIAPYDGFGNPLEVVAFPLPAGHLHFYVPLLCHWREGSR